jgi:hypothetical protein
VKWNNFSESLPDFSAQKQQEIWGGDWRTNLTRINFSLSPMFAMSLYRLSVAVWSMHSTVELLEETHISVDQLDMKWQRSLQLTCVIAFAIRMCSWRRMELLIVLQVAVSAVVAVYNCLLGKEPKQTHTLT